MHRTTHLTTGIIAALLLTGCSAAAPSPVDSDHLPDTVPVNSQEPTPTSTTNPEFGERVVNDHGYLVKTIGQLAGVSDEDGVTLAQFAVTDIVVDIECGEYADKPQNGHFVGIHLNIETTPELAQDDFPSLSFSEWAWQAYDAEGKRVNDPMGSAYTCIDSGDMLPADIGPAQSVSGWVVLDLPTTTGSVALTMGTSIGWEWEY